MRTTLLVTYEDDVLGLGHPIRNGASRQTRGEYNYPNGSTIHLVGLEDVNRVLSGEYDIIYIQQAEECDFDDVQTLTTRLSGKALPYRQLLADCNPQGPTHWIKEQERKGWLTLVDSNHCENPLLYDNKLEQWTPFGAEYIAQLDAMQGFLKQRMRHGLWVQAEGARFPQLDPAVHKFSLKDFENGIPATWDRYVAKDYGIGNPFCALWVAIDHDGNAWVYREEYEAGLTADVQAQRVIQRTGMDEKIRGIYPDPTIFNNFPNHLGSRPVSTYDLYEQEYSKDQRFGPIVRLDAKPSRRRMGFEAIDSYLTRGNRHPNLYIEEGCVNLWKELESAVWDMRQQTIREDIDPKCADHAITALYYLISEFIPPSEVKSDVIDLDKARALRHKQIYEESLREFTGGGKRVRV